MYVKFTQIHLYICEIHSNKEIIRKLKLTND